MDLFVEGEANRSTVAPPTGVPCENNVYVQKRRNFAYSCIDRIH